MEPRPPDSVYSIRLVEDDDEYDDGFDDQTSLTSEEITQLENIEAQQIEEFDAQEIKKMEEEEENIFKQTIIQSKKELFEDIVQKLNLTKSRIQEQETQEKFNKLEQVINQYFESINPIELIDTELDEFIDWLCDKTIFSRYKYKQVLKSVFVNK